MAARAGEGRDAPSVPELVRRLVRQFVGHALDKDKHTAHEDISNLQTCATAPPRPATRSRLPLPRPAARCVRHTTGAHDSARGLY